jgi:hypothetical protein
MAGPVPFRRKKKGVDDGPWISVVPGRGLVELGSLDAGVSKEQATQELQKILDSLPAPVKKTTTNISDALKSTANLLDSTSTSGDASQASPADVVKPVTAQFNGKGLQNLSPAKIAKFRELIAGALATGNVSLDRALVTMFRDEVPVLRADQYMLLSAGWELACEQYFINGVPPPWIIILLGNALCFASLAEGSKPKKIEPIEEVTTDAATAIASGTFAPGQPKSRPN